MALRSRFGLRTQLLGLFAALAAAFLGPVYLAGSSAARALLQASREEAARGLGRTVAAHVDEVARYEDPAAVERALTLHHGPGGILAGRVTDHQGRPIAACGPALIAPQGRGRELSRTAWIEGRRAVVVELPLRAVDVTLAVDAEVEERRAAPIGRLLVLLGSLFAAGLALVTWVLLGRLFVRPLEGLVANAEKIAHGARTFAAVPTGTAETETLAASLRAMSLALFAKEQALEEKVRELGATTLRLSETSTALVSSEHYAGVGKLAAGMAHEIGNPIAALLGLQELVLDGDLSPEEQRDFVARMHKETTRIHGVLRDLLDYARGGGAPDGRSGPQAGVGRAEAGAVLADAQRLLAPQRSFKGVSVVVDLPDELPLPLPPERLLQVLLNLALNAADAMASLPPTAPRELRFVGQETADARTLTVEDSGPGVPEELREKIFDPFVTTKDVGAGTGLGLAVCRGIVEGAGGTLRVSAAPSGGAAFTLRFPRRAR